MDRLELREEPMTRWGGVALGGDLLLFLIFAAMGRASHGLLLEGPPLWGVVRAAIPFALAWLMLIPLFGGHRPDPSATFARVGVRTGLAWLGAWSLGLALRSLLLGRPAPLAFALITLIGNGALLLAWRLLLHAALRRRAAPEALR
jgi:hypothetical protein